MRDAGIGRVLVASLHQGIADVLPTRLEFYENWFNPSGLRDGTIGLAPLTAVLSFLRREGEAYALVTDRAGLYAAEWTVDGLPAYKRAFIRRLPVPLRLRMALGVSQDLVRRTYSGSRAIVKVRRAAAHMDIRSSIFCGVREPAPAPLCGFYAAAVTRVLESRADLGFAFDTSDLSAPALRGWIKDFIAVDPTKLTLLFESFGFKHGVPLDADLVFDVRCLPNPHYEPLLAPLDGRDARVMTFLESLPEVERMYGDIYHFVASWLPDYARDNRNYLTVAIGCTGGRHRSVYLVERLSKTFGARYQVLARHRELG